MKYSFLFLMILCCLSCKDKNKENDQEKKEETKDVSVDHDFDWLEGNWLRSNEKEGKQTYENWIELNEFEYQGLGFTMKDNDTIWKETMRLVKTSDTWNFEVIGKDETIPTIFMLTEIKESSFICVNEVNEFPKKIRYSKSDNGFIAVISGGDMEIPFEFEPVNMN